MIRNDTFENHMDILNDILLHLKISIIQFNAVKFEWAHGFVGYLGFVVMWNVIYPQP